MAPSGRHRGGNGHSHSDVSTSSASSTASASSSGGANNTKSLPAILARKRKSDCNDINTSQESYSSTASSSSTVTFSNLSLALMEESDLEEAALAENLPPELLHPRNSNSSNSTSTSSRMPLSALSNSSSNRMTTSSSSHHSKQSPKQLLRELPKLKMAGSGKMCPPPAKKLKLRTSWSQFREFIRTTSLGGSKVAGSSRGSTPFPTLKWADKQEMWDLICKKEFGMYKRKSGPEVLERHPALQARMRAILFDWVIEVCEVYRLHRETFYLAVDFVDRYLSVTRDVPKNRLQLIGVTCLFIAAKIEEIYPPKLSDFAYVTDGACKEDEILTMEIIVLKELNWGLSPMTPNAWVKLYLQVSKPEEEDDEVDDTGFVTPRFSGVPYVRVMQLMDLAVLDTTSLSFRYSILAAAAVAVIHGPDLAVAASGHRWEGELQQCVSWLLPFAAALAEDRHRPADKPLPNVSAGNMHNIQSHSVDLAALDRAQELVRTAGASSPDLSANPMAPPGIAVDMTPPEAEGDVHMKEDKSRKKQLSSPTISSTSSSSSDSNSVFLSPETPTSSHRHQQSRSVMNAR